MRIRCTREFRDLEAEGRPLRKVGDVWDWGDPSRVDAINAAGYGKMAGAVEETAPADGKPAPTGNRASSRKRAVKPAQDAAEG